MAETLKTLGQVDMGAASLTTLYTVPAATSAVISSVVVCNRNATAITFRLSVRVAALADTPKQYLYYDVPIPGNDTFVATMGITLAATDIIAGYASGTGASFSVFGTELT
jgi:ribosomal protein S2